MCISIALNPAIDKALGVPAGADCASSEATVGCAPQTIKKLLPNCAPLRAARLHNPF